MTMRNKFATALKAFAAIFVLVFALNTLTACADQKMDMTKVTAVIDVRTPAEIAETGHLEGALTFDWQGSDFAAQADNLDKAGNYVVYCRSGNRAGQAIAWMQENGFTGELTNGGGLADAQALTGLAIVAG
jgi:rhodanese-related sulfurtransferase